MIKYRTTIIQLLLTGPVFTVQATGTCQPRALQVRFDHRNGQYDGMSQRGVMLDIQNAGSAPCELDGRPDITFYGSPDDGTPVTAQPRSPAGLHPGPAIPPVLLASHETQHTLIRWVSGDVFADSDNCITTSDMQVTVGGYRLSEPAAFRMCAPKGSHEYFTLSTGGRE